MKILTLNTRSLLEEDYERKLDLFVEGILKEMPDIVALQEVNQTFHGELLEPAMLEGQYPMPGCMNIRADNHAAQTARRLRQRGVDCYWVWIPVKLGHECYDEGVAVLSLGRKIRCADAFPISRENDYHGKNTRAVVGIQVEGLEDWFYTVHMDRWEDTAEGFLEQWKILNGCVMSKRMCGCVWLLGDFNAPDDIHGQSYEHIVANGWIDTWQIARQKDGGITVPVRTGHGSEETDKKTVGLRLDYIWCSKKREVLSSRTVFNGTREPVVSEHFGIMIEVKE